MCSSDLAYAAVAVALVGLSLRRGRPFDALIIVVALLVTAPLILAYRRQALGRSRGTGGSGTEAGDTPSPGPDER